MSKEYIKKVLETAGGFNAECSVATGLWIDISQGSAYVNLDIYKDFASKEAGKSTVGKRQVIVSGIDALPIFATMHDVVVSTILADPQYVGGTLEIVEDEPIIEEPII